MSKKTQTIKDQSGRHLGPRALRTRQKWLDATGALLENRSILEISVAEIARHVGSVPSLFYHYFKDVESAAQELARDSTAAMPGIIQLIDGEWDEGEGLEQAKDLVSAYIEHWEKYHGVLLLRNHAADRGDPDFHIIRRDALQPLIEKISEKIQKSQSEGRVSISIHPFVCASALVSMLENLSAHVRNIRRFDAEKQDLIETCARMIYSSVTGN